jgi:HAMP domain-containing protein
MFKNLKLKQKFTLALLVLLLAGIGLSGLLLSTLLRRNAQTEVTSTAVLLMDTMNSVREYTSSQVRPELVDELEVRFLPETVPAYSAREVFEHLRESSNYEEFFYKEATLNPTNLRDKADDFEATIVEDFRQDANKSEIHGFRVAQGRKIFYTARPLSVGKASCLECHGVPADAPQSMIEYYGPNNGFGWQLNEIVGAQIISVPASNVIGKANKAILLTLGVVSAIFALILVLINYLLSKQVVDPLRKMAKTAEEVSRGNMGVEFDQHSKDEVGNIAQAFTRMKRSLMMAMDRISANPQSNGPTSQGRTNSTRPTWSNGGDSNQTNQSW